MTAIFHARPYGKFIEVKSNFVRKKLYRMYQDSNLLGSSFNNRYNVRAPVEFKGERQSQTISSKTNPSIYTSLELLDPSKETSRVFHQ